MVERRLGSGVGTRAKFVQVSLAFEVAELSPATSDDSDMAV